MFCLAPYFVLLAFRTIKLLLETSAEKQRQNQIRWKHSDFLQHVYHDYAKTLSPEEWEYLPPSSCIMEIDTFKQFRDTLPPSDKQDMHPGYIATFFPSFIEGFQRRQRNRILELASNIELQGMKIAVTEDSYKLAALVVSCKRYYSNCLIGWKNIFRHLMTDWEDCRHWNLLQLSMLLQLFLLPEWTHPKLLLLRWTILMGGSFAETVNQQVIEAVNRVRSTHGWNVCVIFP